MPIFHFWTFVREKMPHAVRTMSHFIVYGHCNGWGWCYQSSEMSSFSQGLLFVWGQDQDDCHHFLFKFPHLEKSWIDCRWRRIPTLTQAFLCGLSFRLFVFFILSFCLFEDCLCFLSSGGGGFQHNTQAFLCGLAISLKERRTKWGK